MLSLKSPYQGLSDVAVHTKLPVSGPHSIIGRLSRSIAADTPPTDASIAALGLSHKSLPVWQSADPL